MGEFTTRYFLDVLLLLVILTGLEALAQTPAFHVGRTPSEDELRTWDISIGPAGKELPAGRGTAQEGAVLYAQKCALCHGRNGEGGDRTKGLGPRLVGGKGTLHTPQPVQTVGSYWPFATTIWDYIHRAMPLDQPGTLQADQVYALTAFLLYRNDIIQENEVMDAKSLPQVQMPNRDGFVPPKPVWPAAISKEYR